MVYNPGQERGNLNQQERELTHKRMLYTTEKKKKRWKAKIFCFQDSLNVAFNFFFFNKRLSFSLQAALETVITIYCPKPPPDMHCVILLVLLAKPLRSHKPAYEPSVEAWQFTPVETLLQWFYNDLSQPNVTTHYGKCRWTVLKGQHQEKSWFFFFPSGTIVE